MFIHRLCIDIGCTISELNQRMDSAELSEWMAYYSIQNEDVQPTQTKQKTNLSVEDEIALMKEGLA